MKRKKTLSFFKKFDLKYKNISFLKLIKLKKFPSKKDFSRKLGILRFFFRCNAEFYNYNYKIKMTNFWFFFKVYTCFSNISVMQKQYFYQYKNIFVTVRSKLSRKYLLLEYLSTSQLNESSLSLKFWAKYLRTESKFTLLDSNFVRLNKLLDEEGNRIRYFILFNKLRTYYITSDVENQKITNFRSQKYNLIIFFKKQFCLLWIVNLTIYLIKFKPYSAGYRHKTRVNLSFLKKFKKYFFSFKKKEYAGRNTKGCIVVRHRGGSNLRKSYWQKNYFLLWKTKSGVIMSITKCTSSTGFIGLLKYSTGSYTYIIIPHNVWVGSLILSKSIFDFNLTNVCFIELCRRLYKSVITYIKNLSPSVLVSSLCLSNKHKSQYARSAGTFCRIIILDEDRELALLELPTGYRKWLRWNCIGITGRVSNIFHKKEVFGQSGSLRLQNIRPTVRGVAMNPVDHPHGGRTKSNSPEVTPWGKIAKHNK